MAFTDHLYAYEVHGDRKVSTKELARQIGCKKVEPCKPEVANKHSGYLVGGRRGYLVGIDPKELRRLLAVEEVEVAAV